MKFRSLGRAALALAVLPGLATLLTSCGGGHTIGYGYVLSNPPSVGPTIYGYNVRSDNGALSPGQISATVPATGLSGPVSSVTSPDHKSLYVLFGAPTDIQTGLPINNGQHTVVHYGINTDSGELTPVDSQQTAGTEPVALALDPAGQYLYAVDTFSPAVGTGNVGPGDVTVWGIQTSSNGTLTAPTCSTPGLPVPNGAGCYYAVGFGPRGVAQTQATTNGSFVYVTNSGNTATLVSGTCYNSVSGFTVGTGGALTPITFTAPAGGCTPYPAGSLPLGVAPWAVTSVIASANGSPFVYITDYQNNLVYAYLAAANGTLSNSGTGGTNGQGGYSTGNQPEFVVADPRSKFLYISNFRDGTLTDYVINSSTGALSAVNGSPTTTGTGPTCIAIDPTEGIYLYVTNYISGSVSGYQLNGSTGQLSVLPNSPFLTGTSAGTTNTSQPTCISLAANGSTPTIGTP